MARRCVTVAGPGTCCRAMTSGFQPGQVFSFHGPTGRLVCGVCHIVNKRPKKGSTVQTRGFRFAFAPGCATGANACPALNPTPGAPGTPMLTSGGTVVASQGIPMLQ